MVVHMISENVRDKVADIVSMSGADRISSLSDPLLHYILSFLKTTEVVSTRILSKRWKHLWTCVPTLKLKSYELRDESKFEHFLNFVFEHRQKTMTVETFELWWGHCTSTFEAAERWLSHVVKCQPRVIILDTTWTKQYLDFSDYVFKCESLEELTLSTSMNCEKTYAVKPKSVNLKCLKKLDISGYLNVDDDFMRQLMLGSPILEELQLTCSYEGLSTISSDTLKHLEISLVFSNFLDEGFEISIPSLVYLYLHEDVPGRFSCINLESLVDAYIHISHCSYGSMATLLRGISNASKLSLHTLDDMALYEEELPFCPIFNNLKEMTCEISSFYPVPWLLQHAPNLEKLTLRYYYFGKFDGKYEEENYVGWDLSFSCKKLKMLEIYYFGIEELQDVLNLLSNGKDSRNKIHIKLHRLKRF